MMAGIDYARATSSSRWTATCRTIPTDIPLLLAKLDEGYDVVSGWRKDRKDDADRAATCRAAIANCADLARVRRAAARLRLHAQGLPPRGREGRAALRRDAPLHSDLRELAGRQGDRDSGAAHHPRVRGESKYGLERIVKVLLDLIVVKFLDQLSRSKPIYVFGGFGICSHRAVAAFAALWALYLKFFEDTSFIQTPLPLLVVHGVHHRRHEHPHGPARRDDHAHLLRVAGQARCYLVRDTAQPRVRRPAR